ncbi:uncharacterized protein LOC134176147 [Corticium candelabrum]|uniref:uncharacterized protein LOC134176147 n=1 Tax=Corticium candelabrum TaxID=121492 RepID=UPI002E26A705|nr:uncharacterized protein LOC134176147 [Corticium candelabrum]
MPEIGFGEAGIRSHLMDSMREHRRRIASLSMRPKEADEPSPTATATKPKTLTERNICFDDHNAAADADVSAREIEVEDEDCSPQLDLHSALSTPIITAPFPFPASRKRLAAAASASLVGTEAASHCQLGRGERAKRLSLENLGVAPANCSREHHEANVNDTALDTAIAQDESKCIRDIISIRPLIVRFGRSRVIAEKQQCCCSSRTEDAKHFSGTS